MSFWGTLFTGLVLAAGAALVIAVLTADDIIDWFRARLTNRSVNAHHVGVTLLKHLHSGNYQVVQGIFNTATESVVERRVIQAERIDGDVLRAHDENGIAIWT